MEKEKEPKSTRLQVRRWVWWSGFQRLSRLEMNMKKNYHLKNKLTDKREKRELCSYDYPCPSSIGWKNGTLVEGKKGECPEEKENTGK